MTIGVSQVNCNMKQRVAALIPFSAESFKSNFLLVCFGIEHKEDFKMKMFLFKHIWRKEPIIIEMTRGPYGNPALMRNDPLR